MSKQAIYFVLISGGLALQGPSAAQTPLSMEQAVQLSVARAPKIRAALLRSQGAEHQIRQAKAGYWPRVRVHADYLARAPKNALPLDNLPVAQGIGAIDDVHHVSTGLEVGLRLFDLTRGSGTAAARCAWQSALESNKETAATLAYQVRAIFLSALLARDVRAIAAKSLSLSRDQERQAALRNSVGTGSAVALAQTRVRSAQLEAQLRQAENDLGRYTKQLAHFLGLHVAPDLSGDLAALTEPWPPTATTDTPALRRLRLTQEAAQYQAEAIRRRFIPTVDLIGKADWEYPHVMRLEWGPLVQGGVSLNWQLFDGGLRAQQAAEADAKREELTYSARAAEEALQRKWIELSTQRETAQASVQSAQEIERQQQIYVKVARAARDAGTGTDLEVHQAELGLDQARVSQRRALFRLALLRAEALLVSGNVAAGAMPSAQPMSAQPMSAQPMSAQPMSAQPIGEMK